MNDKTAKKDQIGVVPLEGSRPARRPLRNRATEAPDELDHAEQRARQAGQDAGYHDASAELATSAAPKPTSSSGGRVRLNFAVPENIGLQIRRRMLERGSKSYKAYILDILREAGEIQATDDEIADQRGLYMRSLMRARRSDDGEAM